MTLYLVLMEATEQTATGKINGGWKPIGEVEAASANAAIRSLLSEEGISEKVEAPVEYVAVPARSWQPVKVQVETALKFS